MKKSPKRTAAVVLAVAAFLAVAVIVDAGNLEPPGPPAPTMRTLDVVEPRTPIAAADLPLTITAPGSYYATEDLFGGGITINTEDVTLDLNGFTLFGNDVATDGVSLPSVTNDIEIRNGVVSFFGLAGIDVELGSHVRLIDLRVTQNGGAGIRLGTASVVDRCLVGSNSGTGIELLGNGNLVSHTKINNNTVNGIYIDSGSNHIRANSIALNGVFGISVVDSANNQTIVDNLLTDNGNLSINMTEFSAGHIVARNISRRAGPNSNNRPGDWGPLGTAAAATSPWANIEN